MMPRGGFIIVPDGYAWILEDVRDISPQYSSLLRVLTAEKAHT